MPRKNQTPRAKKTVAPVCTLSPLPGGGKALHEAAVAYRMAYHSQNKAELSEAKQAFINARVAAGLGNSTTLYMLDDRTIAEAAHLSLNPLYEED